MPQQYRDPVRSINAEFLSDLEVVSNKIYPLPGATFDRPTIADPRVNLKVSNVPQSNKITYFEHIATIRHKSTNRFFVAFRETMDALYARQQDTTKYPAWLMDSPQKKTELKTYIYAVRESSPGVPLVPSQMPKITNHEDWLVHIGDGPEWIFDTISYFLLKNNVIDSNMYGSMAK